MKDRGSNPRWRVFTKIFFSFFVLSSGYCITFLFLFVWGCSSYGRAFALHARGTGIDTPHLHLFLSHYIIYTIYNIPKRHCHNTTRYHTVKKTTTAGFEPTLPKGNCLAGNRLNHSATLSSIILYRQEFHYIDCQYNTHNIYRPKLFLKKRQWQDLNLRIQRIIDFKSIALDHSATLSYTTLLYFPLPDIYDYTIQET